jgi:hypothetical protein
MNDIKPLIITTLFLGIGGGLLYYLKNNDGIDDDIENNNANENKKSKNKKLKNKKGGKDDPHLDDISEYDDYSDNYDQNEDFNDD